MTYTLVATDEGHNLILIHAVMYACFLLLAELRHRERQRQVAAGKSSLSREIPKRPLIIGLVLILRAWVAGMPTSTYIPLSIPVMSLGMISLPKGPWWVVALSVFLATCGTLSLYSLSRVKPESIATSSNQIRLNYVETSVPDVKETFEFGPAEVRKYVDAGIFFRPDHLYRGSDGKIIRGDEITRNFIASQPSVGKN